MLAMGSKENLKVPFTLLSLVGVPVYVIADGDAGGAERKYPNDSTKQADAAASHQLATESLLAWLPGCDSARVGKLPCDWGSTTTVTDRWCVLQDDLEAELEAWPDYMKELDVNGHELRSKNVAAVRSAVSEADLGGLASVLRELIKAVTDFGP